MSKPLQTQPVVNPFTKWRIDFSGKSSKDGSRPGSTSTNISLLNDSSLNPPGYTQTIPHVPDVGSQEEDHRLMAKRSWEVALGPLKQAPMNLFIMYMAGNSISIFPIMMVGMMFVRPFKALLSVQSVFSGVSEGRSMIGQKFVFILGNLVGVALALYKCSSMGLLPTHQSDWLAFVEPQHRIQHSYGGFVFN